VPSLLQSLLEPLPSGRYKTHHVGDIATPEGEESLLLVDALEAVDHALVPLVGRDTLVRILRRKAGTSRKFRFSLDSRPHRTVTMYNPRWVQDTD
jgi:hypothetical protein